MTTPLIGGRLGSVTLSGDEIDLLLHLLGVDELPVVLATMSRFDTVAARDVAFAAARESLQARGLLRGDHPHPGIVDRLAVLARPTVELALRWYPGDGAVSRMCLAQGPAGVVLALRAADTYVLADVGTAEPDLVLDVIGRGVGLDVGSVSAPTEPLAAALHDVTDPPAVARRLTSLGVAERDADRLAHALGSCRAHAEIVALTHREGRTGTSGPVTVFDTGEGRIVGTTSAAADGAAWCTLGPGGDARVRQAVRELLDAAGAAESV
ncbi:ESX secretion-associated protein EspG [Rhodococcus sp. NPDC003322]